MYTDGFSYNRRISLKTQTYNLLRNHNQFHLCTCMYLVGNTHIHIYTEERRYSLKVRKGIFNPQGTE